MNFNGFIQETHLLAQKKGWWESVRSPKELLALVHSEIAEATEEVRRGAPDLYQCDISEKFPGSAILYGDKQWRADRKPEGEAIELMDAAIRVFDILGYLKKEYFEDDILIYRLGKELQGSPLEAHFSFHQLANGSYSFFDGLLKERMLRAFILNINEYFKFKNWDFDLIYQIKSVYNQTREKRHGGKKY